MHIIYYWMSLHRQAESVLHLAWRTRRTWQENSPGPPISAGVEKHVDAVMLRRLPSRNPQGQTKEPVLFSVSCFAYHGIQGQPVRPSLVPPRRQVYHAELKGALRRKVPHAVFEASATADLGSIRDSQITAWLRL
jgi:hypothetical protein